MAVPFSDLTPVYGTMPAQKGPSTQSLLRVHASSLSQSELRDHLPLEGPVGMSAKRYLFWSWVTVEDPWWLNFHSLVQVLHSPVLSLTCPCCVIMSYSCSWNTICHLYILVLFQWTNSRGSRGECQSLSRLFYTGGPGPESCWGLSQVLGIWVTVTYSARNCLVNCYFTQVWLG